jgi:hypothetical protein
LIKGTNDDLLEESHSIVDSFCKPENIHADDEFTELEMHTIKSLILEPEFNEVEVL